MPSCNLLSANTVQLRETETTRGDLNTLPRTGVMVGATPSIFLLLLCLCKIGFVFYAVLYYF